MIVSRERQIETSNLDDCISILNKMRLNFGYEQIPSNVFRLLLSVLCQQRKGKTKKDENVAIVAKHKGKEVYSNYCYIFVARIESIIAPILNNFLDTLLFDCLLNEKKTTNKSNILLTESCQRTINVL